MPTLQVTTKTSEAVWSSPDGTRTIHKVGLDYQGKTFIAKTYSDAISKIGWSGSVDTEERPGRDGIETFVKQTPKPGGFGGGGGFRGGGQKDPLAMYTAYAKDVAVAFIGLEGKLSLTEYEKTIDAIVEQGKRMFDASKEGADAPAKPAENDLSTLKEVMGDDVVVENIGDEPLKLSDLPDIQ